MGVKKEKKLRRIAIFANGWSCEFLSIAIEAIRGEAVKDGADVFVFVNYNLPGGVNSKANRQKQLFNLFDAKEYDGVIVLANTLNTKEETEAIQECLEGSGIPVVSTEVPFPGAAFLGSDNYHGVYELAQHLMNEHKVKNVVYVSGYEGNEENAIRKKALADALAERDLVIQDTIYGDFDFYRTSVEAGRWLEDGNSLPDAFVCANDHMALGIISSLFQRGIDVPGDVIVTGFDNIRDGQYTSPLVATVSRGWDELCVNAYRLLAKQLEAPDPGYEKLYPSYFIPSESCGCPAPEEAIRRRLEKMRNLRGEMSDMSMVDFFFQEIRLAMAKVESKEQFLEVAERTLGKRHFFGNDYSICIDPIFFAERNEENLRDRERYSERILSIYEHRDGGPAGQGEMMTSDLYPGYKNEEGVSNLYVIAALYTENMGIGYLILKNNPSIIYESSFRRWINNLESLMINIRQYIFAQKDNRALREIYMSDYLAETYNRNGCENVIFPYIEGEKKERRKVMLLFVDINCMKEINDEYGHLNGDLAIKVTAKALKESLPESWLFGRYGGDEFIAVGPAGGRTVEGCRERFEVSMKRITKRMKLPFTLSASLGAHLILPEDEGSVEDFIRMADESMYEEKEKAHRLLREERKRREAE
ncbi:MAG: GGDEF domain-containing protein [Lachnospiraceae bacterium]|nr:GGDEF domain-containing protein [Lachnospiraceae bacterium]